MKHFSSQFARPYSIRLPKVLWTQYIKFKKLNFHLSKIWSVYNTHVHEQEKVPTILNKMLCEK
jgi:hypothetical protein